MLSNGKVLVGGGFGYNSVLSSAELYDPAGNNGNGTWTATGSLNPGREYHTATLLPNDKVLVAGGNDPVVIDDAELYDPASGTWTPTRSLNNGREYHTATLLPSGKVLATGGYGGFPGVLSSAELYDPAGNNGNGTWTATSSLTTAREKHTATLLSSGTVLVAGGYNGSASLSSAELYGTPTPTPTATPTPRPRR